MSIAYIFDTETTGFKEPQIIQAAGLFVEFGAKPIQSYNEYFRPTKPIEFGAKATHHIVEKDLEGCRLHSEFTLPAGIDFLIGHNVDFDWKVIGEPSIKRICTLALARQLWPQFDSHSQGALLYALQGDAAKGKVKGAHSADIDVEICLDILNFILKELPTVDSWKTLWEISETARLPTKMLFGKYKDTPIAQVPRDYINWLLRQPDVDPYLIKAFQLAGRVK